MKKQLVILFFSFCCLISRSENADSLKALLKTKINDTLRIKILNNLAINCEFARKPQEAAQYTSQLLAVAKKTNIILGWGHYYTVKGTHYYFTREYDSCLANYYRGINYYEKIDLKKSIISIRLNIAGIYIEKGDPKKALSENRKLIPLINKTKDTALLANPYGNMGICFTDMSQYDSAIYCTTIAAKINEKFGALDGLATNYCNLASVYYNIEQYRSSLFFLEKIDAKNLPKSVVLENWIYGLKSTIYNHLNITDSANYFIEKSIKISRQINDKYALIAALINQAEIHINQQKYLPANNNITEALALSKEIGSESFIAKSYNALGNLLTEQKQYLKAVEYFNLSNDLELKNNNSEAIIVNLKGIATAYSRAGKFKESSGILDSVVKYKDRLNEKAMMVSMKDLEVKYETEKKDLQIQNANSQIGFQEEKNRQKIKIIWLGACALVITLFLGLLAFINFTKSKKANKTIKTQNRNLAEKNQKVEEQKEEIQQKQKEIIDSINYANRIQHAVLTGEDVWNKVSADHFISFIPKDIVSGDFYWAYNTPNNRSVFALADCTGHGVPGGFMSMLGISFLNEIVIENKIFSAHVILNKLREKIINALEQKGLEQRKDGMDIALCVWNKLNNTLEFSGANNALMLVRDKALTELKPDKMPIGTYIGADKPFTSQTIQLQAGDCIYLTTDGFPNQFGGAKGKKFKYRQTEELLLSIHHLPMKEQLDIINKTFSDWKGSLEQIDDVSLIGIRI